MRDVNKYLRRAYNTALNGVISVPVYYDQAPNNTTGNYVIFRPVSNSDISTKSSSDVSASMQVVIYTESEDYNDGNACDDITSEVLQAIYPNSQAKLTLTGNLHNSSTELVSDNADNLRVNTTLSLKDRTLVFRHKILIK